MDENVRIISTNEELEIFSNSFRLNIINTFREHEEPLTVKGCADILKEYPSKVHYHVKKLLSINILELDHIEVINGINAKYYKLPNTTFSIEIEDGTEESIRNQIEHINNLMISQIEQFKMDFINMSQNAATKTEQERHDIGWFSLNKMSLSKEEFYELEKLIFEFVEGHYKEDENKKQYSLFFGIANKNNSK